MSVRAMLEKLDGQKVSQAFLTYTAKGTGEKAQVTVMLGGSTESLYRQDKAILLTMLPNLSGIQLEAAQAILASREESLKPLTDEAGNEIAPTSIGHNAKYTCADAYTPMDGFTGVRIHDDSGTVHVTGLVTHKVVLTKGTYKVVNSKPLTIAKNDISKSLPSSKFRQYILENVTGANLNGETVEFVTE